MDRRGFTLIELSIVLVIIGLLVAGILVGRDMIASATIRRQISQIESITSAVNVFRNKYNCLAGDCVNGANFGVTAQQYNGCASPLVNNGNGDQIIGENPYNMVGVASAPGYEAQIFWNSLIQFGLIEGDYLRSCTYQGSNNYQYGIRAKAGVNPLIGLGFYAGSHRYFLATSTGGSLYSGSSLAGESLTPIEAFQIDSKIDDGVPGTGTVTASSGTTGNILNVTPIGNDGTTAPDRCVENGNTAYANPQANPNPRCVLVIKAQF